MESAYFYNVFFASVDTLRLLTVPSVDTLTEWLPTDVLIVIGQFIDVKTMEERIRLNKLTTKFKQFKTRTNQEWTDMAVHFPGHFDMIHVKVCSKILKFVDKNTYGKENHYKKETFGDYCYLKANEKYDKLRRNIVYSNLSRFNPKYQGQKHVSIDGNTFVALPQKYWHEWHYGIQGCAPLHW